MAVRKSMNDLIRCGIVARIAEQQKALETSLKTFPATLGPERWDKIAEVVPGKLRAECIARYKQVVAALKAKKAAAAEAK